jgi:hypothetical protein
MHVPVSPARPGTTCVFRFSPDSLVQSAYHVRIADLMAPWTKHLRELCIWRGIWIMEPDLSCLECPKKAARYAAVSSNPTRALRISNSRVSRGTCMSSAMTLIAAATSIRGTSGQCVNLHCTLASNFLGQRCRPDNNTVSLCLLRHRLSILCPLPQTSVTFKWKALNLTALQQLSTPPRVRPGA